MIWATIAWLTALYAAHQPLCAIVVSAAVGGVLGIERELRGKSAGIRTFAIVCMSSCVFTLLSVHAPGVHDSTRLAAQVISGVGFVCAGVIWRKPDQLEGLTTAAGMWGVAAIGMAIGYGFASYAFTAMIAALIVMEGFGHIVSITKKVLHKEK
jgi:putative Mg2+ transporter-C (MgtC) family protein